MQKYVSGQKIHGYTVEKVPPNVLYFLQHMMMTLSYLSFISSHHNICRGCGSYGFGPCLSMCPSVCLSCFTGTCLWPAYRGNYLTCVRLYVYPDLRVPACGGETTGPLLYCMVSNNSWVDVVVHLMFLLHL